jgi:hypothetical protein
VPLAGVALLFEMLAALFPLYTDSTSVQVKLSTEQWYNGTDKGKPKYWEKHLSSCYSRVLKKCTNYSYVTSYSGGRQRLKCDGTRAETRFRLSTIRTSPFKSAGGGSVQSTTGSRCVRISGSNVGYTVFRGSVNGTGYQLHSPVTTSLPLPCVTVCHHVSTGLYSHLTLCIYLPAITYILNLS